MMTPPIRRFRAFRPGRDKESDRWCSIYPDHVEVFPHMPDGKGGIVPNPEFETAQFELTYEIRAVIKAAEVYLQGSAYTPMSACDTPYKAMNLMDLIRDMKEKLSVKRWGR